MHRHVARELTGADAHERDAIAMARIHVRLDLEDESGELTACRVDAGSLDRRRRHRQELVEKELHAEVRYGASEEDRRRLAFQHRIAVELLPRAIEQLDAFAKLRIDQVA